MEFGFLDVCLGRGVAAWVNERGGNLYVWTERPSGRPWIARTETQRPLGVEFARCEDVDDFRLWLECDETFSSKLRVKRRWFGLRDGVAARCGYLLADGVAPFSGP